MLTITAMAVNLRMRRLEPILCRQSNTRVAKAPPVPGRVPAGDPG
jgi:hypothetical protein